MSYTIRTARKIITTVPTYGDALAYANTHTDLKNHAITWGDKGSKMNLSEWRLIANHTIARLNSRGVSTSALLANDGTR